LLLGCLAALDEGRRFSFEAVGDIVERQMIRRLVD